MDDANGTPDDSVLIHFPATVIGLGLHNKKWMKLAELIKAVATAHVAETANTASADCIAGKGNGLIMLLQGSAGTCKTLTAEPLYRVTFGDIGTEPDKVEFNLVLTLRTGTTWDCNVLINEADPFLEQRRSSDLRRNALLSAFLQGLEDHNGILILTSNLVGTFDAAIKRLKIWMGLIGDLEGSGFDANTHCLAQHTLNGRQIRNLAEYEREELAYDHVEAVIGVTNEIEEYLVKPHMGDETDWKRGL
ncbi:hypothetical protein B0J12DRAFT_709080 [Macrophomina phaseolina]|uniref:ATPase AAA-type core domain-containing protein n=1 Tax=Macrophomina phaseolina TaxID=35725 RepID=A0ABQ8GIE3_9PEZI|nr:hypothetical protein B0J12DRAFT_709080 [Macrophomina phaseolina]